MILQHCNTHALCSVHPSALQKFHHPYEFPWVHHTRSNSSIHELCKGSVLAFFDLFLRICSNESNAMVCAVFLVHFVVLALFVFGTLDDDVAFPPSSDLASFSALISGTFKYVVRITFPIELTCIALPTWWHSDRRVRPQTFGCPMEKTNLTPLASCVEWRIGKPMASKYSLAVHHVWDRLPMPSGNIMMPTLRIKVFR